MAGLDRRGAVFVLTLGDDENRFHPDRLAEGIVAATAGEGEVFDGAVARAEERAAKAGPVFGAIKARLYAEVIAELTGP